MINVSILRGKIVERNMTQEVVADEMGINRSTFYRKMKEYGKQFTVEEVQKLAKILSLTSDDVMKIFL
ncbi:MAG: helix-turn-helix domain-containing protein [Streptococcaceae bacterium]|jgi:DNA-binding NtrC family response regulator|nr:helix-turn-helix domain-containing protein [Streptococcaceae bacterium]